MVSAVNDKTIVVKVESRKPHPVYGKMMTTKEKAARCVRGSKPSTP